MLREGDKQEEPEEPAVAEGGTGQTLVPQMGAAVGTKEEQAPGPPDDVKEEEPEREEPGEASAGSSTRSRWVVPDDLGDLWQVAIWSTPDDERLPVPEPAISRAWETYNLQCEFHRTLYERYGQLPAGNLVGCGVAPYGAISPKLHW